MVKGRLDSDFQIKSNKKSSKQYIASACVHTCTHVRVTSNKSPKQQCGVKGTGISLRREPQVGEPDGVGSGNKVILRFGPCFPLSHFNSFSFFWGGGG